VNEDDLRAAFARHEAEAPDVEELHTTINKEAARRRRRRSAVLSTGVAAGVALAVSLPIYLTGPATPAGVTAAASSPASRPAKDVNLLLLGSDHRGSWAEGNARADTIVMVHIPADRKKIYLISVMRDTVLAIPGHGEEKINAAFYYGLQKGGAKGGLELVEEALTQLSGVKFDGGAVVEYAALRSITDTLGGVPVCLPQALPLERNPIAKPGRELKAGCQTLNGTDAQALIQQRYGLPNGGYDRDRNTQRYLLGVAQKAAQLDLGDAATILRLVRTPGLTIDLAGITAPELALQLRNLDADDVVALSLSNTFHGDGRGETIPAPGRALLKALKEGDLAKFAGDHPEMALQH